MSASPAPSSKALGKRPINGEKHPAEDHVTLSSTGEHTISGETQLTAEGAQSRQKRVLPSRSRRGGPGVGNCDVDHTIIESLKRKTENDPLIPSTSAFLLTTDSSLIRSPPSASGSIDSSFLAIASYFERPEVIKSYQEQKDIQTPEFTQLTDDKRVGGRLRARGEEESADTSDAAYEKRHRKYETFEKRQRFREKEKLKHEHYKLKERIDQLRAMDNHAFLHLPASLFSPVQERAVATHDDPGVTTLPGATVNGAAIHNEGERRRQQMLDIATALEERYRVLLPADRKGPEKGKNTGRKSVSMDPEPTSDGPDANGVEDEADPAPSVTASNNGGRVRLKISVSAPRAATSKVQSTGPAPSATARLERARQISSPSPIPTGEPTLNHSNDKLSKYRPTPAAQYVFVAFPESPSTPPHPVASAQSDPEAASAPATRSNGHPHVLIEPHPGDTMHSIMYHPTPPMPVQKKAKTSKPTGGFLATSISEANLHDQFTNGYHNTPNIAGIRQSISVPSGHNDGSSKKAMPAILVAASRNADAPSARKTSRGVLAFGVKIPREIEEQREFEIPPWVHESNYETDHSINYDQSSPTAVFHMDIAKGELVSSGGVEGILGAGAEIVSRSIPDVFPSTDGIHGGGITLPYSVTGYDATPAR